MGVKLLSLNTNISWSWFQLLTNHIPCGCIQIQSSQQIPNIKLIDSDGVVKIFDHPVHVSELMSEFPKHLVCRSDSFYIGQKTPPLSEDDQLQLGHEYFLLPKHFFQSALSFVTIASCLLFSPGHQPQKHSDFQLSKSPSFTKNSRSFLKKAASCQLPFDFQRTPGGDLRIRISEEFISSLSEEGKMSSSIDDVEGGSKICTSPQLVKEYVQLAGRRKWEPKLETIKESHRYSPSSSTRLSSFGINKRKAFPSKAEPTGAHRSTTSTSLLRHRLSSMKPNNIRMKLIWKM